MKHRLLTAGIACLLSATAVSSQAANSNVADELRGDPDLSSFYQALVSTGVINELNPSLPYTIFAPTNEALGKITRDDYPCFYSAQCKAEVAQILRNHIVPGNEPVNDVVHEKGGVYSLNDRLISISEPYKDSYLADGMPIGHGMMFSGGMLYKLSGVIATPYELAVFQELKYPVADVDRSTTTQTVNDGCDIPYCPDAVTRTRTTTTVTHTTALAPAAGTPETTPPSQYDY